MQHFLRYVYSIHIFTSFYRSTFQMTLFTKWACRTIRTPLIQLCEKSAKTIKPDQLLRSKRLWRPSLSVMQRWNRGWQFLYTHLNERVGLAQWQRSAPHQANQLERRSITEMGTPSGHQPVAYVPLITMSRKWKKRISTDVTNNQN